MSKAITKVEQTPLGALVARREQLQKLVSDLKTNLRHLQPNDPAQVQERIADQERQRDKYRRIAEELESLQISDELRTHLKSMRADVEQARGWIQNAEWQAERLREGMEKGDEYTRVSNALADAEGALDEVRQQIKDARSNK